MPNVQKDPSGVRDFSHSWAVELDGEAILTSEWKGGLVVEADSFSGTTATVRVSGGADGCNYEMRNTITTSSGETREKSIVVAVREQ